MLVRCLLSVVVLTSALSGLAVAAVSETEAKKLKAELTPYGAERAGNKKGTIPQWRGGLLVSDIPEPYRAGMHHPDPFARDRPRFKITAQNMDQYADLLSDGLKGLLNTYPDTFVIPFYPTRRSASAYDTPITSADGIVADDVDIFNGAGDRYDWTFIGKQEMIVPYNNTELHSNHIRHEDLLTVGHVNPKFTRFELHRVWVIEGSLKNGQRHRYAKRRFYLDEDSWNIVLADQFNDTGELWRVSVSFLKNYYEVPVLWTALDVYHDLKDRRYYVAFLDSEEDHSLQFSDVPPPDSYSKPAALRRRMR